MDLYPTDTDDLLAEGARALLAAEAPPERLAAWEQDPAGFDRALWGRIVGLGWPAVALPEVAGGGGGGLTSVGVLAREVGRAAFPSPFLAVATAGLVAARLGTTKRASTLLEAVARDGAVAALAWTPGCGAEFTAVPGDGGLSLHGRLVVEWAHEAETLVCLAPVMASAASPRSDARQPASGAAGPGPAGVGAGAGPVECSTRSASVAVVAVDTSAPGLQITPRRPFDNERVAVVTFDGVRVGPGDQLIDGGVADDAAVAGALGAVRLIRAAELVGIAERILDLTAAYVTQRIQFGVPIGSFQAVQHACADIAILVDGARLATDEGLSGPGPYRRAGALAGWLAGRAAAAAAITGAQLHGGVGMIRDYPLHFFYRRAKAMQLRLGSAAAQLEELAAVLVDPLG